MRGIGIVGAAWASVGGKLALGTATLALVAGAIGAVALTGQRSVGVAVDQTGASVAMLSDVNAAGTAVMEYLESNSKDAAAKARAAVASVQEGLAGAGLAADEVAAVEAPITAFSGALDKVVDAAETLKAAQTATLASLQDLRTLGTKVQADGFARADQLAAEADEVAKRLAQARIVVQQIAAVQVGALRTHSSLKSHALTGEPKFVIAAGASLGGAWPIVKKLRPDELVEDARPKFADLSGQMKQLIDLSAKLRSAASPLEAAVLRDKAIALLDSATTAAEEIGRLQAKAADKLAYEQQGKDLKRASALKTSRLGADFSALVADLAAETFQYRGGATPGARAKIDALAARSAELAKGIEADGFAGVTDQVAAFRGDFGRFAAASSGLRKAGDGARGASLAAAGAIRDLADTLAGRTHETGSFVSATVLAAVAVALVLAVAIAVGLHRSIALPVRRLTAAMRRLSEGDTEVALEESRRRDEIGAMLAATRIFRDNAVERRRLAEAAEAEAAARNARQERLEGLVAEFRSSITALLGTVTDSAGRMEENASGLAGIAGRASGRAVEAAGATGEAAGSVQTVASAAEELACSIQEIGRQTASAVETVEKTTGNARNASDRVSALAQSAERIGSVVSLIRSIAEQTNLLALNATIEAARAGEAGRGFAVVAGEVKGLAGQTAKATDEIAQQVLGIQEATEAAVAAIRVIMADMAEVNRFTGAIAAAVEQQGAATGEISRNVASAAENTGSVGDSVEALKDAVAQTSLSSGEVLDLSRTVSAKAREVNEAVDRFLAGVAAA